jgi:hypothetical protein
MSLNNHFPAGNNKLNMSKSEVFRKIFQDIQFKERDVEQPNFTGRPNYNAANTLQKASQSEIVRRLRRTYTDPYIVQNSI